jgi:hypothetical protein
MRIYKIKLPSGRIVELKAETNEKASIYLRSKYGYDILECQLVSIFVER